MAKPYNAECLTQPVMSRRVATKHLATQAKDENWKWKEVPASDTARSVFS